MYVCICVCVCVHYENALQNQWIKRQLSIRSDQSASYKNDIPMTTHAFTVRRLIDHMSNLTSLHRDFTEPLYRCLSKERYIDNREFLSSEFFKVDFFNLFFLVKILMLLLFHQYFGYLTIIIISLSEILCEWTRNFIKLYYSISWFNLIEFFNKYICIYILYIWNNEIKFYFSFI